jgi:hypothetical protein
MVSNHRIVQTGSVAPSRDSSRFACDTPVVAFVNTDFSRITDVEAPKSCLS